MSASAPQQVTFAERAAVEKLLGELPQVPVHTGPAVGTAMQVLTAHQNYLLALLLVRLGPRLN